MLYFEDALWIRESFWTNTIGTLYFVLGFCGIALHLVLISILPEISSFISRPTTVFRTCQFVAAISQLLVVFVPVPAMIAVRRAYFLNEVLINVPAFLLVTGQTFAFGLMLLNGVYRNLRSVSLRASKLFFIDKVLYIVISVIFCFSFYFAINICAHTTIRRFNPTQLNWTISEFEASAFKILVIVILAPCQASYLVAISIMIRRKLFVSPSSTSSDPEDVEMEISLGSRVFNALFDGLFAGWLCLSFYLDSPIFSLLHIFLTAYWPVLTVLALDIHIRAALIYRVRGIFQPASANSPIVIRANKKDAKHGKF